MLTKSIAGNVGAPVVGGTAVWLSVVPTGILLINTGLSRLRWWGPWSIGLSSWSSDGTTGKQSSEGNDFGEMHLVLCCDDLEVLNDWS